MIKSLYTAATGMKAQQSYVDAVSNNLANVNTNGFKRSQPTFQDLLYVTMKAPGIDQAAGVPNPVGIQLGSGVKLSGTTVNFQPGVLEATGRKLDVAITGDGFFQILLPDGSTGYTRDGHFQVDGDGRLVTSAGNPLLPNVQIPQDTLEIGIAPDGTIKVTTSTSPDTAQTLAQLQLARFVNPAGLMARGQNYFIPTDASGQAIVGNPGQKGSGLGQLLQSHLERSNVEVVSELVNLIVAQRAYEVNSRAIRASDDMLTQASSILR
ncbi:MAG: flagellar basal-body rod protein FlgG [Planctomycetota bacterium]